LRFFPERIARQEAAPVELPTIPPLVRPRLRAMIREILRAEILLAIGFFAGCGLGGVLAGIASVFGGPVLYWGGLVALTLLFAIIARGRAGTERAGTRLPFLPAARGPSKPSQIGTVR
jgi:hypothetical protein